MWAQMLSAHSHTRATSFLGGMQVQLDKDLESRCIFISCLLGQGLEGHSQSLDLQNSPDWVAFSKNSHSYQVSVYHFLIEHFVKKKKKPTLWRYQF